jgi:ABC-type sugar transport system ATPase subunit
MAAATASVLRRLEVGVPDLGTAVGLMSGGQRQAIAVARAAAFATNIVILDEPTAALGLAQKQQVLDLVKRLQTRGLAVVLISHNLAEVFAVADRIEVLRLGRNIASFPGDEKHSDDVVAAITGARQFTAGAA